MAQAVARVSRDKSFFFPSYSFHTRLSFFVRIWLLKFTVFTALRLVRFSKAKQLSRFSPSYTKRYSVHPSLENRIFLSVDATQSGAKYPLLFSIYGGGFAICDPLIDDHINRRFADDHGFVVVAVNYRKAPRNPFPGCMNDVANIIRAVLADRDLPVDYACVGIIGFSAGGVLSLSVAQLPDLRDNVHFLVPMYPATDFSKVYRGECFRMKGGSNDVQKNLIPAFDWAYIPPGTDTTDPLLSPVYATREQLPQRIYFVPAEYDVLCKEALASAKLLADASDELAAQEVWEKNGIKFRMVPGVTHGFTHPESKRPEEVLGEKELEDLYQEIAHWIKKE